MIIYISIAGHDYEGENILSINTNLEKSQLDDATKYDYWFIEQWEQEGTKFKKKATMHMGGWCHPDANYREWHNEA